MTRHKILAVFGTRPEAIKMAPVIKRLEVCLDFENETCITAQHREMLDQVLRIFRIQPRYDLNIMRPDQDLFDVTVSALVKLKTVILESKPDLVLVQGDTTTALVASLAAFYLGTPIAHIEAGLRTYNKYSPFPEEINRRMIATVADFNFAPTRWAERNLLQENIAKERIFVTGNTVVDALYEALDMVDSSKSYLMLKEELDFLQRNRRVILVTGHRRENFGEGFKNMCSAIRRLAETFGGYDFVYPVHLNPNVRKPVQKILNHNRLPNMHLIEPLAYLPFIYLMKKSYLVLTDSGGVQEEAITFGKPILVLRDTTERHEGIEAGAAKLVGNSEENIFYECSELLTDRSKYDQMATAVNPYGDGHAAERIVKILHRECTKRKLSKRRHRNISQRSISSEAPRPKVGTSFEK
jgi:UDP-N-acetylglucosamine 2-epimerase (non-hydrolysing)